MNLLSFEDYLLPAAELGAENPLPVLPKPRDLAAPPAPPGEGLTDEDRKHFGYGRTGILPHRVQDGYSRDRRPRRFHAAVLENEILRATFLPELGGRLWSLIHKPSGRELLHANAVFQPANLAVRNAWFCGGVEWNMGVIGHGPQTCSPLFAARAAGPRGEPALRLYEWDRTRCAPYQLDAYLPDGSSFLYVRIGLVNPHDREIPMYWWSNIAVAERTDVRVLAPAVEAISHGYKHGLGRVPVPVCDGTDQSYATRSPGSRDWFYVIPDGRRRWIAALDGGGCGLVQTSTDLLRGRKLFVWGMGAGGRRWQEFLSGPGRAYLEIQAGLARTQMECIPMPARARWSWVEAYGLLEADASRVHGADWAAACGDVESRLERLLPGEQLPRELPEADRAAARPPAELVQLGSGWGALERRRRAGSHEAPFAGEATPFPDESLGAAQAPWLSLLEEGSLPAADPTDAPPSWMVQDEWADRLARSLRSRGDHWLSRLHMGVIHYHNGRTAEAKADWERSLTMTPSAWANRNLAEAAGHAGRAQEAADRYQAACGLLPGLVPLAIESVGALLAANRAGEALAALAALPPAMAANGRLRLLNARAAVLAGQPETAIDILARDLVVADLREGEISLSDLWFQAHEQRLSRELHVPVDDDLRHRVRAECPLPPHLDFRMAAGGG